MKKALLLFVMFAISANVTFAQQASNADTKEGSTAPQNFPQPPAMPDLSKIPSPAMFIPPSPPVIGTFADGSFVLLAGSRLYRYDNQMKLVKEVQAPYAVPGEPVPAGSKA